MHPIVRRDSFRESQTASNKHNGDAKTRKYRLTWLARLQCEQIKLLSVGASRRAIVPVEEPRQLFGMTGFVQTKHIDASGVGG